MVFTREILKALRQQAQRAAFDFMVHYLVGLLCFGTVVAVSLALDPLIEQMQKTEMNAWKIAVVIVVDRIVFCSGVYLFLLYFLRSVVDTQRDLFKGFLRFLFRMLFWGL